jgi:ent-kaurene oxidase
MSYPEWTSIEPYPKLMQLFARITSRVTVGPELCRDEEWLNLTFQYTNLCMKAIRGVRAKYPPSLRWLAQYMDADTKQVLRLRRRAAEILSPYLHERQVSLDTGKEGQFKYMDTIGWLVEVYKDDGKTLTADQLAQDEFILNVASINSGSSTTLSILYDLMEHPNSISEIRQEIERVQKQHTAWTRLALTELKALDSFMKESLRVHAVQQCRRLILKLDGIAANYG